MKNTELQHKEILQWLREDSPERLKELFTAADRVRKEHVGDEIHLRGLIEISNYCTENCNYCGIRNANSAIERYRMDSEEIIESATLARDFGYGTVVMQAGEDPGIEAGWLAEIIGHIKHELGLAVTLSLGERPSDELKLWREAGADRYLLRFESSDPEIFRRIHGVNTQLHPRLNHLKVIYSLGYETGSGVLVGVPGQTYEILANDILLFRELDLHMIGVGPYVPHPRTPLAEELKQQGSDKSFVPNNEEMVYKVLALTRLICPDTNIPSTTALATINSTSGRQNALNRGANIVMPNLTPLRYRKLYEIYPSKASSTQEAGDTHAAVMQMLSDIGRPAGRGHGGCARAAALKVK